MNTDNGDTKNTNKKSKVIQLPQPQPEAQSEVKIEIIQSADGTITLNTFSEKPVTVATLVGIMEVAKTDVILNTGETQSIEMFDVVLDELDLKLNEGSEGDPLKIGQKIQLPKHAMELRTKMRAEAEKK